MMSSDTRSYAAWAQYLGSITGLRISKQAIFERMNSSWVLLVKKLLEIVIAQRTSTVNSAEVFKHFNRVLLQDSTCFQLPDYMGSIFKGSFANGKEKSVAKLNLVMDILSGKFIQMQWVSFTKTEQALSENIIGLAHKGDLVIRDLGYSVLNVFEKMSQESIYFLSRLKFGISLYDAESKEPLNLLKLLKGKSHLSLWVLCGRNKTTKARLVAIKLSEEQAAERKRRAKHNRDKRLNHTQEYYKLLNYVIFITNVTEDIWDEHQVANAYRVRWNIEIIFKSWKSGLNIKHLIPQDIKHTERIESILYLMMLYVLWFQMLVYIPLKLYAEKHKYQISIIKLSKNLLVKLNNWITNKISNADKKTLAIQCCYEIQHDRTNAAQRFEQVFGNLA